jgi:hypothetical protein
MASDAERDTSRTVVKTYVPAYQRAEWDEHADELGMSRSEFVKAMVQAGRSGFDEESQPEPSEVESPNPVEDGVAPNSESPPLEETVLETLSTADHHSWEELLASVTNDLESRLEQTLQQLQSENRIRYSGRHGGYTLDT